MLAGWSGVTLPDVGGGGKAPNFWTPIVVTRERLDRLCSNVAHLLSTRKGAGRRVWGHVTKCWGRGKAPKFWGPPLGNSRTAGPILFKLCMFTKYHNGSLFASSTSFLSHLPQFSASSASSASFLPHLPRSESLERWTLSSPYPRQACHPWSSPIPMDSGNSQDVCRTCLTDFQTLCLKFGPLQDMVLGL